MAKQLIMVTKCTYTDGREGEQVFVVELGKEYKPGANVRVTSIEIKEVR